MIFKESNDLPDRELGIRGKMLKKGANQFKILGSIYGKFMGHQFFIQSAIWNVFYRFV